MREFAKKGSRLQSLSTEAKVVYTGFVVFSLVGLFVSVALYSSLLGGKLVGGARQYYAGESAPMEDEPSESVPGSGPGIALPGEAKAGPEIALPGEPSAGPDVALPDDAGLDAALFDEPAGSGAVAAGPLIIGTTPRKMLEVTHFHLFTMPIFLLVIGHLFMMCAASVFTKTAMILSATLATAVHIGAPWLIYLGGPSWAWLMPVTGTWMMASMLVLLLKPTWDMWRPSKKQQKRSEATQSGGSLVHAAQQMPHDS